MKLNPTKTKNLFYTLNKSKEKTYYARYTDKGERQLINLGSDYNIAVKMLKEIKDKLVIDHNLSAIDQDLLVDKLKEKIDREYLITKKVGITYYELFQRYIDTIRLDESLYSSERDIKDKIAKHDYIFDVVIKDKELFDDPILFGDIDIALLKYSHGQEVINSLLNDGKKPKTARNYKAVITVTLEFAIMEQFIEVNVGNYIKIPTFDNKKPLLVTNENIRNLWTATKTTRDEVYRLIFLFAWHGRRLQEILTMEQTALDFSEKKYGVPPQKNKSKRLFFHEMTELLYLELKSYVDRYGPFEQTYEDEQGNKYTRHYLFINPNTNKPYTDIRESFSTLKKRAGIKVKFDFHQFRSVVATITINQCGLTLEKVGSALQHSSIQVTEIYRDDDPKASKEVTQTLIDYVEGNEKQEQQLAQKIIEVLEQIKQRGIDIDESKITAELEST